MSNLPALPDPQTATVAAMHDGCRRIEAWMTGVDDLPTLKEALDWMGAVEEYLSAKHAEGPAQTTARLLEARIGEVLGPAESTNGRPLRPEVKVVGHHERHEFRLMAENRDVWEPSLPLPRRRVLRLIRDDQADVRPIPERPTELLCDIRLGDFRTVLADVEDGSVDLVLTDPPYPAEFLPLWSDLATFAKRVLAPHGMLAAMSGQVHLPEVYQRLGEHLPYRWTMAYLAAGAHTVIHARQVMTMWKPVLVYGSTQRRLWDVATSKAPDKEFHGWGQSETGFADLLRLLADPGALVVDPFVGGGTTAVVAAAYGCHFIGAELDETHHATALRRLA